MGCGDRAHAPAGIQVGAGGSFIQKFNFGAGYHGALADAIEVLGNAHDAVGIVAG